MNNGIEYDGEGNQEFEIEKGIFNINAYLI